MRTSYQHFSRLLPGLDSPFPYIPSWPILFERARSAYQEISTRFTWAQHAKYSECYSLNTHLNDLKTGQLAVSIEIGRCSAMRHLLSLPVLRPLLCHLLIYLPRPVPKRIDYQGLAVKVQDQHHLYHRVIPLRPDPHIVNQ